MEVKLVRLKTYIKVWFISTFLSAQTSLENRLAAGFFLMGKFIRFGLYLFLLYFIHQHVESISGYNLDQMINFFLVFNLIDLSGQFLFRGIYWFRSQIISGEFDFRLLKPISSLFQALTRQTDILDFPLLVLVILFFIQKNIHQSFSGIILFLLLYLASLIIVTAIHIFIAGLGVLTTEVDHTIMIFRDLSAMARFPVDIYQSQLRSLLTFIIPVGIAYTFPAKAIMGLLSWPVAFVSLTIAITLFTASLWYWHYALESYSSASS